jgi:hypothetical protein
MSEQNPFTIFVTHTFQEHEEYARVFEFLESRDKFFYINCSNPAGKPEFGGEQGLQEVIREQIKDAEIVLFPVGIHSQDPHIVDFELTVAQAFNKPIVAIQAFGGTQALPMKAMEAAIETIAWDARLIVDAIKKHGRGEETAKWDVIEFDPDEFKSD